MFSSSRPKHRNVEARSNTPLREPASLVQDIYDEQLPFETATDGYVSYLQKVSTAAPPVSYPPMQLASPSERTLAGGTAGMNPPNSPLVGRETYGVAAQTQVQTVSPASTISDRGLPALTVVRREPLVIRGTGKKSPGLMRPPRPEGRRVLMSSLVGGVLSVLVFGSLLAVLPIGADGHTLGDTLFRPQSSLIPARISNTSLIIAQATATAVTQDGYDSGFAGTYAGVKNVVLSNSAGDHFYAGQCTYWASWRYHDATGYWVPWLGNAEQWLYGAEAAGWVVSSTPNPNGPSIIVLQGGVQGASWGYGHVAVVENINADGSVHTSNWNWLGNWGRTTYVDFRPGSGVSFVWHA